MHVPERKALLAAPVDTIPIRWLLRILFKIVISVTLVASPFYYSQPVQAQPKLHDFVGFNDVIELDWERPFSNFLSANHPDLASRAFGTPPITITVVKSQYQLAEEAKVAQSSPSKPSQIQRKVPKPTNLPSPPPKTQSNASNRELGRQMAAAAGWTGSEWNCLELLWHKESGWRENATNGRTWGIPQSLPGNKMASAGADWKTNPATQIAWGIGYIKNRYGTACAAWGHSQRNNWY